MPQVSVIIPTYNRAKYVTMAIDSALAQTYTDYEIIVVDDGSTDQTQDVLKPYMDKIHYIYQSNKGVSAARNTGIRSAKGEWIAFLDSDDEWLPEKLETQIGDIRHYPEAILSCTNVLFKGNGTESIDFFKKCLSLSFNGSMWIQHPLFRPYAFTPSVLVNRKKVIEAGLFDEDFSIYEDIDLFFRLSTKGGFVLNSDCLVEVYRRPETWDLNLSSQFLKDKKKHYETLIQLYQKLFQFPLTKVQRSYVSQKLSSSWFDFAVYCYYNLEKRDAYHGFLKCFKINPSIKTFSKMLLGFSGTYGLRFLEKRRNAQKGFRRSEFYQNEHA